MAIDKFHTTVYLIHVYILVTLARASSSSISKEIQFVGCFNSEMLDFESKGIVYREIDDPDVLESCDELCRLQEVTYLILISDLN